MAEEKKDNSAFHEDVREQDEEASNPREMVEVSLSAITGMLRRKTIQLQGILSKKWWLYW